VTTAALVLAAGGGTRFTGGEHKLTVPFRGRPLYQHALQSAIDAGLDEVIVVVGAIELDVPAGVTVVRNENWRAGQATSLAAGLAAAEVHDAVVVGLADQPAVPADAWRLVAGATQRPVAVATYDGRRANPVRLAREIWPLLPRDGDEGARVLIRRRPELVIEVPCPGHPGDIDTQEDLATWN